MDRNETAQLIREIVSDLTKNPSQFNFQVTVYSAGFVAANTGGVGYLSSMNINAPVDTAIGMQASGPTNVDIQIIQEQATGEINAQMQAALDTLSNIAAELERKNINKSRMRTFLGSLQDSLLPSVISGLVVHLVSRYLGA